MKNNIKLKLRKVKDKNVLFNKLYSKLSHLRTKYNMKLNDEKYLKKKFFENTGDILDIDHPKTYNEKLQWLKLYDRKIEYSNLVDKYEVRNYVKEKIGEKYLIPLIGVWDNFDEINFDALPNQFVLKCTHDSGSILICKNKREFNYKKAKKFLTDCLSRNYYYESREWPYKNAKPRIIAEQYIIDKKEQDLKDYKVFNFNGIPKLIQVDFNRFTNHKRNIYTTNWKYLNVSIQYPNDEKYIIEKPEKLNKILELSKILSQGYIHVRTDFYIIDNNIYFGEITFYHGSGFEKIIPNKFNLIMGSWVKF